MKKAKRKSISTKIAALVIVAVLISNIACIFICINSASNQLKKMVKNNMITLAETYASTLDTVMTQQGGTALYYEKYAEVLKNVKIEGIDSSYVYVVGNDGTMLYHPTRDKVGQPVENVVIKSVIDKIIAGERVEPGIAEYDFRGVKKYASYNFTSRKLIVVVSADESDITSGINRTTGVAVAVGTFMSILFAIVAIVFSKRIAKPLVKVSALVEEVANGNMRVDFKDVRDSQDEVGLIVSSVKGMTASLAEIVDNIRATGNNMAKHSSELNITSEQTLEANGEISRAVEDVAEGSTNMAASISSINDNLDHMSGETGNIESSVGDIRHQTKEVQERSASMNEKMLKMQRSSEKMDEGISYISQRIQKVNEVVGRVEDIISVIEEISEQTNLLSLNASIEAARAGEAGRGFAVVAEEIRVLSDNTNSELNNIKAIIAELIKACDECVSAAETVVDDNKEQKNEISNVLEEFTTLDSQIELTAQKTEEIKVLMSEMVELNANITQSSDGLTDVSASNAAATEEVTANIQELNAMMHGVANIASQMDEQSRLLMEALRFFH